MNNSALIIQKIFRRVVSSLINLVAYQTNYNIKNTTLIVGSTRSGTTFLMESINKKNEYRLIFEPFNKTYTDEWQDFATREWLDPAQTENQKKKTIKNILTGRINNSWINRYNRKVICDRRLIKAVRANLLVEYIRTEYPTLPIIYLIRNPYDVVASRINMNFDARDIFQVLDQTSFLKKYYSDIDREELMKKLDSKEAKHAALWCIENRYLLQSLSRLNLHLLHYENIIGKVVSIENNRVSLIKKESKPSASSSPRKSYKLSNVEKNNITNVLKLFKMTDYNH